MEDMARRLEANGCYRVLRYINLNGVVHGASRENDSPRVVAVADLETTGLAASAKIIELAIRRLRIDRAGRILEIGHPYSFLEDPGEPLSPQILELTGLSDSVLADQELDEPVILALLRSCDCVIFHNAVYDVPRLIDRLPALEGTAFACSLNEIDWRARGFREARKLGCLLCQTGQFTLESHRAGADVDATIALLASVDRNGRTALGELLERAAQPTLRFSAVGAAFGEPKDRLRERGYRWDPEVKVWWREVPLSRKDDEEGWLREFVYAPQWHPACEEPHIQMIDWRTRYV